MSATLITLIVSILTAFIVYLSSCTSIPKDMQTPFTECPLGALCPNTDKPVAINPSSK